MEQLGYHAAIWGVGFLAGISRTVRSGSYRSCAHLTSSGACCGFLAYGLVTFALPNAEHGGGSPSGIALAALVGLAGQELHDFILDRMLKRLLGLVTTKDEKQ